jgi:hypothetical protein
LRHLAGLIDAFEDDEGPGHRFHLPRCKECEQRRAARGAR